jgi:hypothetical protein
MTSKRNKLAGDMLSMRHEHQINVLLVFSGINEMATEIYRHED